MRIRKNAKLSPMFFSNGGSGGEKVQTYICKLNQSPWDVIPFSKEPDPDPDPFVLHHLQLEGDDSLTANASLGDSIGAVESVASMMEAQENPVMKLDNMIIDDNANVKPEKVLHDIDQEIKTGKQIGLKTDAKNLKLESEHKPDHHPLKSCNNHGDSAKKCDNKQAIGVRRGRARAGKKGSSSASNNNPYEYYYYSGFGPLWGKRRGDRAGEASKNNIEPKEAENNAAAAAQNNTPSSSSQADKTEEFDYVDDEDDDEEENGSESGKKRMRKPVKARSLKSLM